MEKNFCSTIDTDVVVIYHAECKDGFGAAYAAWKKFGDTATYIPRRTQLEPPEGLEGKELYIVDYSYDVATLRELEAKNKHVVVIDHHRSAEADVKAFSQNVFDLDHSGAVLTWQYFYPDTPVPELLCYVEDHDLWKFSLPDNQAYNAALREYPAEFEVWDELIKNLEDEAFKAEFLTKGATIVGFEEKYIESVLRYKHKVQFEGYTIYALNTSRIYRSILGHRLARYSKAHGGAAIGAVYYYYDGRVHISLRSEDEYDVSEIAKKFGGGGHKHAASFSVESFKTLPFMFLE